MLDGGCDHVIDNSVFGCLFLVNLRAKQNGFLPTRCAVFFSQKMKLLSGAGCPLRLKRLFPLVPVISDVYRLVPVYLPVHYDVAFLFRFRLSPAKNLTAVLLRKFCEERKTVL